MHSAHFSLVRLLLMGFLVFSNVLSSPYEDTPSWTLNNGATPSNSALSTLSLFRLQSIDLIFSIFSVEQTRFFYIRTKSFKTFPKFEIGTVNPKAWGPKRNFSNKMEWRALVHTMLLIKVCCWCLLDPKNRAAFVHAAPSVAVPHSKRQKLVSSPYWLSHAPILCQP